MPGRVVDASVMAAWCFEEARAEEARTLLCDAELYAPTLLVYELADVATRRAIDQPDSRNARASALARALALPIRWRDIDPIAVFRLAVRSNLTAYDASYLYLARTLSLPLLTFDRELARAAGG